MPGRVLPLICLLAFGCARNRTNETVTIDDNFSGFRITSVDGRPPRRHSHPIHKVTDSVLVEPGTHTFTGEYPDGTSGEATATVEPGKVYRTSLPEEPFGVVEGDAAVAHKLTVKSRLPAAE